MDDSAFMMVSIIIPCKNEEKTIGSLLLSMLENAKEHQNVSYEIIVIDDNSIDHTQSNIEKIASDKIRFFGLNEKSGTGAARNFGMSKAVGRYIYFLDADDEFVGFDVIEKLIYFADKYSTFICGGNMEIRDNGVARNRSLIDPEYTFVDEGFMLYSDYQYDYGFTRFIYNRDFLISNNICFPERKKYEDPIFMHNAFFAASRFYKIPITSYIVNAHPDLEWNEEEKDELLIGIDESLNFFELKKYYRGYINTINRVFSDFKDLTFGNLYKYIENSNEVISKASLWKVVFPKSDSRDEVGLYYHSDEAITSKESGDLILSADSSICFESYFNSFSLSKWKKYTCISSFGLLIDANGSYKVSVYGNKLHNGICETEEICSLDVNGDNRKLTYINIGIQTAHDVVWFKIQSLDAPVKLYSASYIAPNGMIEKNVKLAAVMTTFNREDYLHRNVREFEYASEMNSHLYVVDNSGTTTVANTKNVTVIRNKNTGGAGGFARGMIEVSDNIKDCGYTHLVLMDDDIDFDSNVFIRLEGFLTYLKDEFNDSFVGGSMLRRDIAYFLVETGAKREGLIVKGNGYGLDMRDSNACMINNAFENADYNAWWFCCIPISLLRDNNLPLPLFFQWDDVDYGVRNKENVITMNGICVWHDCFESKRSAQYIYYSTRNPLIVDACHEDRMSKKKYLKHLRNIICDQILMYRYHEAEAAIRGVEDFLKGPDWIINLDQDEYNRKIMELNAPLKTCKVDMDRYHLCIGIEDCDLLHKLVRIMTFNGMLMKANRKIIIPLYACRPVQTYRATEVVYYDELTNRGYTVKKDFKRALKCYKEYRKLRRRVVREYDSIGNQYKERYSYMTSREMWEKILFE